MTRQMSVPQLILVRVRGMILLELIRDTIDSAEASDDETRQPPKAVASTSKEINKTPPPRDSNTGSPTAVFEYEDTRNDIELSEENVQGIVTLRMERNAH